MRRGINLCDHPQNLPPSLTIFIGVDNSAIHQADLTIRSVLAADRAKSIKVIDCGHLCIENERREIRRGDRRIS